MTDGQTLTHALGGKWYGSYGLTNLFILRDPPSFIRSDNDPGTVARQVRNWVSAVVPQTTLHRQRAPPDSAQPLIAKLLIDSPIARLKTRATAGFFDTPKKVNPSKLSFETKKKGNTGFGLSLLLDSEAAYPDCEVNCHKTGGWGVSVTEEV